MMMNQNFALQVYYWFYLRYGYDDYNRVVFDMTNILDTPVNDFQACETTVGRVVCKIRINNQIIMLNASIDSLYTDSHTMTAIRLSMFKHNGLISQIDDDADVEGLKRKIKRWKIDHLAESKYWDFSNPWGVDELTVRRFIPIKELNGKPIYEGIKHIDTAFNELVKTYTDLALSGGNDNDE